MVNIGDRVQIDETCSNYYGRCGMVIGDDFCETFPYEVEFDDSDTCIFNGKDLIVLSIEKFKVGDKVKILNTEFGNKDKIGTITNISGSVMIYFVEIEGDCGHVCQWSDASDLELVEEEKVMKFKVGDKVKVKDSWFGHDGQVGVVLDTANYGPFNYNIKFDTEGDNERRDENFKGDSLELVTEEEEKVMKFKVGDKVKILNTEFGNKGKIGIIENISGTTMIYFVKLDGSCNSQWSNASDLELVTDEETNMGFEVGDEVRVRQPTNLFHSELGKVVSIDHVKLTYKVVFHRGISDVYTCFDLILVKRQEEKVMKFKVGDKVKVKDSWFGHAGQVGVVFKIDNYEPYNYSVKFDVEGDNERRDENFKDDSLELVKQQFTKSDLKTGMGVVLRNGDKAHVLLGTDDGDVMRFLEKDNWDTLKSANEDLTWKGMDNFDIVEVYSTKLASRYLTDMVFEAKCVFKREEPKPEPEPTKMTMKEINEHFGKPIEIVE